MTDSGLAVSLRAAFTCVFSNTGIEAFPHPIWCRRFKILVRVPLPATRLLLPVHQLGHRQITAIQTAKPGRFHLMTSHLVVDLSVAKRLRFRSSSFGLYGRHLVLERTIPNQISLVDAVGGQITSS